MKFYFPYKSDKPEKKYFIVTNTNKKVYFGQAGAEDFTTHRDEERRQRYITRHKSREDWTKNGINSAGFWSYHYLWHYPTKKEAYNNILNKYL